MQSGYSNNNAWPKFVGQDTDTSACNLSILGNLQAPKSNSRRHTHLFPTGIIDFSCINSCIFTFSTQLTYPFFFNAFEVWKWWVTRTTRICKEQDLGD